MKTSTFTLAVFFALTTASQPTLAYFDDFAPSWEDDDPVRLAKGDKEKRKGKNKEMRKAKRKEKREQVMRKMRTFLTVELTEELKLNDSASLKLSKAIAKVQDEHHKARKKMKEQAKKLKELVANKAGDNALKAQMKKVRAEHKNLKPMEELLIDECASFLSVQQQARLMLQVPHLKKEIGKMLRKGHKKRNGHKDRFRGRPDHHDGSGPPHLEGPGMGF